MPLYTISYYTYYFIYKTSLIYRVEPENPRYRFRRRYLCLFCSDHVTKSATMSPMVTNNTTRTSSQLRPTTNQRLESDDQSESGQNRLETQIKYHTYPRYTCLPSGCFLTGNFNQRKTGILLVLHLLLHQYSLY